MKIEVFGSRECALAQFRGPIYVVNARCDTRCHHFRLYVALEDLDYIRDVRIIWDDTWARITNEFRRLHPGIKALAEARQVGQEGAVA